ncbi:MAG: DivIVA domain-containing protein [Rhodothermales bacterium]|nr:DivIVA domain-containing protein [Rhodothermales bacterium]
MLTLSSMDIKNQEFKKSLRGLDESEVTAFLESVATQWQERQDEMRRMEDRITELDGKIAHYQRIEEALQEAISTAKSSTAAALDDAQRRAQLIVEEANLTSRQITNEAMRENERLRTETTRLAGKQTEVAARLRAFLKSELELLDHFDKQGPYSGDDNLNADESRFAPLAGTAVEMHSQSYAPPVPDYESEPNAPDVTDAGQPLEPAASNGLDATPVAHSPVDPHSHEDHNQAADQQDVHAMQPLEERGPNPLTHEWQPSIGRATVTAGESGENHHHVEVDDSWPADSEEVMNPAAASNGWQGDTIEPDSVFVDEGASAPSQQTEEPYNVSEDELEKIRRILDDLD